MAGDLNFEGRITVKDEGSKEFVAAAARMENAARKAGGGVQEASTAHEAWGRQLRESTRAVRDVGTAVLSQLNPAVGAAVGQFQTGVVGASRFGVALGGITVVAA